jgi:replicative DNA helicase
LFAEREEDDPPMNRPGRSNGSGGNRTSTVAFDRVPPQSLENEQGVLGSMMIARSAIEKAREILRPSDFYRDAHRIVFDAICNLNDRSEPADLLTLTDELRRLGQMEQLGGPEYLTALIDAVPTAANVEYYSKIVQEKAVLRNLIEVGMQLVNMGYEPGEEEVAQLVDQAEQAVFAIGRVRRQRYFVALKEIMLDAMEALEHRQAAGLHVTGVPTGFSKLDEMTAGLQPGDFVIVAGRPGMGKSALCLNFAVNAARVGRLPVGIFSLEMGKEQLVQRMLCSEALVDSTRFRSGYLRQGGHGVESDYTRLVRAMGRLGELPLYIDDSTDISVLEMRSKARRLQAEVGLGLVIVDYLQLARGSGFTENRNQEISVIARGLKSLARELNCPVVALSQLSRAVERRDDKRPMLSDLRESGSIEAEADLVMMLYRSSYYNRGNAEEGETGAAATSQAEGAVEESEILIAKHRNGPTGTVRLGFMRRYATFTSLDSIHEE